MGGDHGPAVTVPAGLEALQKNPHLDIIFTGDKASIETLLCQKKYAPFISRVHIMHTTECVGMDEAPAFALRNKKNSSMRVAVNLVKEEKARACVSAGNTGALMATAHFVLKTLPGIDRPAIVSTFPTKTGKMMRMLDLGANVDSSADNLFQFAVMGSVLTSCVDNIPAPKIYLLNIGHENNKGNELVKKTHQLLTENQRIHYLGYIEADKIYDGEAEVIVCDGFVGNIALKTSEGVAKIIGQFLKEAFYRNWFTKLAAVISFPILKALKNRINPDQYNGASLIGLKGIVIKSHGGANQHAFAAAIDKAIIQADKNVPYQISAEVARLLNS